MMSKGVTYFDWSNKPQIICSIEDKSQSNYGEHCECIYTGKWESIFCGLQLRYKYRN